jgi:predicted flap endonuclease-1-like 5' DNA nuclease
LLEYFVFFTYGIDYQIKLRHNKNRVIQKSSKGGYKMTDLKIIEGIGDTFKAELKAAGIDSVEELLEKCAKKSARKALAEKTGISPKNILKWANHADLARIKGIGGEYSELLEAAGVDTVVELATRRADNLFANINKVNEKKELVRKLPTQAKIEDWIKQANALPRVMEY